ncbi:MAG: O-antigen ligase family protein [Bacilli bacterium]
MSPWFVALFFAPVSTVFATVIMLLSLVAIRYRSLPIDAKSPVLWSLVLAAYMALTNLWAASAVGSVQITVLQISALFFFVAVSQWGRRVGALFTIMLPILGIALYVYGMGAEVGWWKAVNAVYGKHLLASVFEYHNTFGALELAIVVFAFIARPLVKQSWFKWGWVTLAIRALAWLAFVIGLGAVLGSYSRVAWALTPFALVAAFWIRAKLEHSFWPVVTGVVALVVAVGSGVYAIKVLETGSAKYFLISSLIALVGVAVVTVLEDRVFGRTVNRRRVGIFSGIVILVALAALYKLRHHLAQSAGSIAARLHSISLASVSLQERFYYYRNALGIWGNGPVFGSGGGTWAAKYQAFQTLPYISNEAHSSVIDQLLNGGIVGLALELTVFVFVTIVVVKGARRTVDVAQRALLIAGFLAAGVMVAHSVVDFDFAFGFYQYLFWGLLGLSVSIAVPALKLELRRSQKVAISPSVSDHTEIAPGPNDTEVAAGNGEGTMIPAPALAAGVDIASTAAKSSGAEWKKAHEETARRVSAEKRAVMLSRTLPVATGLLGAVTFVLAGTLAASQLLTQAVAQPGQAVDTQLSLTQTAQTLAPYNPAPYLAIAQYDIQTAQSAQDPALFAQAWSNINAAVALGPWDSAVQLQAALLAYSLGHTASAVNFAEAAHHDSHFSASAFRALLGITMWYGAAELKSNPSAGNVELHRVLWLYNQYIQESKVINLKLFPAAIPLQTDASMQVYLGASEYLLGHYHKSLAAMNPFLKSGRDQAAINLYEIVTVLDDAKLHIATKTNARYKRQILTSPSVLPEYQYLLKI